MAFYKSFYNGPIIAKRYVDAFIQNCKLKQGFEFLGLKDFMNAKFSYFPKLIAMLYATLNWKKRILFQLLI